MNDDHANEARTAVGMVLLGLWLALASCASEPPKPAPSVTPEQVRSHADQTFEKLKQEERARGNEPTAPR